MLQQSAGPEEDALDLLVESTGSATTLLPPPGWESTKHHVWSTTVDVHTRLPGTEAHALGGPVLTLHDVGMNAGSCFGPFFSYCRMPPSKCPELHAASAHYHLTAPGHEPDAPVLPSSDALDLPALVSAIEQVVERFELTRVVGIGVGLGAAAILRAALNKPKSFAAIVLISPVITTAGVAERMSVGTDGLFTRQLGLGLSRRAKDKFLYRWLSDAARESNFSLVQSLEDGLDRLNASNLVRLLGADAARDDISAKLHELKARLLLVTGKESALRYHTEDAFASFNPETTSWLDVHDCGSLVHEEHAEQLSQSLSLLLEALPPIN